MPRLADHEQRRRQITDATRTVVASGGLPAATFQSVAAEAGISVRLVQYYFGTKREFLLAAHREVIAAVAARFAARLAALGDDAAAREVLHAVLIEQLPIGAGARADAIVLTAFHTAALTGSEVGADDTLGAPQMLVDLVADQLRRAHGESPAGTGAGDSRASTGAGDWHTQAWLLVVAVSGLAQAMLVEPGLAARGDELFGLVLDRHLCAPG